MEAPVTQQREGRSIKIAHDVKFIESDYKARKLIRIRAEIIGDEILSVQIRGDFFAIPKEAISVLEEMLIGVKLEEKFILNTLEKFYEETGASVPGIYPQDFTEAIMKARMII